MVRDKEGCGPWMATRVGSLPQVMASVQVPPDRKKEIVVVGLQVRHK